MNTPYVAKVSRRTTLQWLAAASMGSKLAAPAAGGTSTLIVFQPTANGYGTDPQLNQPRVTWELIMQPPQLQQSAVLADLILPASETAPAPSAVGVPDFINEWISAPYPDQLEDRRNILDGLRWIDEDSNRRRKQSFLEPDEESRRQIVAEIADKNSEQWKFFQRFRFLVIGAYYTTPEGYKDIGYTGNVPLKSYPQITDEERAILESSLGELGL
jgi:hypothetical protein